MFLSMSFARANSGEEAPKEGGGEHGGGAEAKAEKVEKGNPTPWLEIESKIQELSGKIKSKQTNISHLFEEKNHLSNKSPQVKEIIQEIVKEHNEMRTLIEQYDKQINMLKYRFPERNAKSARKYDRIEIKSVDEMEQAIGVDSKLSRNIRKMRSQYKGETIQTTEVHQGKVTPTTHIKRTEKSIEDSGSIILQK